MEEPTCCRSSSSGHGKGLSADELSYRVLTVDAKGGTMTKEQKQALREKAGYCVSCPGEPILLFDIKKSRLAALRSSNKHPRTVDGESLNGQCLRCHPELDPRRKTVDNTLGHQQTAAARGTRPVPPRMPSWASTDSSSSISSYGTDNRGSSRSLLQAEVAPRLMPRSRSHEDSQSWGDLSQGPTETRPPLRRGTRQASSRSLFSASEHHPTARSRSNHMNGHASHGTLLRGDSNSSMPRNRTLSDPDCSSPPDSTRGVSAGSTNGSPRVVETGVPKRSHSYDDALDWAAEFDEPTIPPSVATATNNVTSEPVGGSSTHSTDVSVGAEVRNATQGRSRVVQRRRSSDMLTEQRLVGPASARRASMDRSIFCHSDHTTDSKDQASPLVSGKDLDVACNGSDGVSTGPVSTEADEVSEQGKISTLGFEPEKKSDASVKSTDDTLASDSKAGEQTSDSGAGTSTQAAEDAEPQDHARTGLAFEPSVPEADGSANLQVDSTSEERPESQSESNGVTTSKPRKEETDMILSDLEPLVNDMLGAGCSDVLGEILVSTLESHPTLDGVHAFCLQKFATIFEASGSSSLALSNVHLQVLLSMESFPSSESVQQHGCSTILALSADPNTRVALVHAGGCKMVVDAVIKFTENITLLEHAVGALRGLSLEAAARETIQRLSVEVQMAQTMKRSPQSAVIQRDGCALLSNLAVDFDNKKVAVVSNEVLETVVHALESQPKDETVVASACFALKNFAYNDSNLRSLRQVKDVFDVLEKASEGSGCLDADFIIERLQVSMAEDGSLEDQACQSLRAVAETQTEGDLVKAVMDVLRSHEWSAMITVECLQIMSTHAAKSEGTKSDIADDTQEQVRDHVGKFRDSAVQGAAERFFAALKDENSS